MLASDVSQRKWNERRSSPPGWASIFWSTAILKVWRTRRRSLAAAFSGKGTGFGTKRWEFFQGLFLNMFWCMATGKRIVAQPPASGWNSWIHRNGLYSSEESRSRSKLFRNVWTNVGVTSAQLVWQSTVTHRCQPKSLMVSIWSQICGTKSLFEKECFYEGNISISSAFLNSKISPVLLPSSRDSVKPFDRATDSWRLILTMVMAMLQMDDIEARGGQAWSQKGDIERWAGKEVLIWAILGMKKSQDLVNGRRAFIPKKWVEFEIFAAEDL